MECEFSVKERDKLKVSENSEIRHIDGKERWLKSALHIGKNE